MVIWTNWSGSFRGFVRNIEDHPFATSLTDLRNILSQVNGKESFVHAQGSKWAFSSPAYCDDIMIPTENLNNFTQSLQAAINQTQEPDKLRIAVEAGIKVRHLYTALAARTPLPIPPPGGTPVPSFISPGDGWTLPTLGGAGGQSIAGAISTGTHGGDVASPPLSDAVLAMLIVGEGGRLRLVQRPPDTKGAQVVNVQVLQSELSRELGESVNVEDLSSSNDILDSAVVSVGRFGIVYAYVLEVISEKGKVMIEERNRSTWNIEKHGLLTKVSDAAARKEFFQIVINPHERSDTDHTCYLTTHKVVDDDPANVELRNTQNVIDARRSGFEPLMQNICGTTVTPALLAIQGSLIAAAITLSPAIPVPGAGVVAAIPLLKAAESIGRIGPDHLIGDAIADVLNLVTDVGLPGIVEMVTATMLDQGQRDWIVKGTRFEISDFFDYDHDCYRGDSVELFFEVNPMLMSKIDMILEVFKDMREHGIAIGAYVSLRFMAKSHALLGLARWNPTCSVEISMLRGLHGNTEALNRLQEVAVNNDGYVHWGQQNDLSQRQVEARFGSALDKWRAVLQDLEDTSLLFSTDFTRRHGLEVQNRNPNWNGWQSLNFEGQSSPSVVSAWNNEPLDIFSQDMLGNIMSRKRPVDGSDASWTQVHSDRVKGRPIVVRSEDGRVELFVLFFDNRIKHCWQEGRPGGQWSSWDTLGYGDIGDIDSDPSIAAHTDGRLEVFARGGMINNWNLFHCWAHWTNGPWSNFGSRGRDQIVSMPSACHRNFNSDQLVVVAKDGDGRVLEKHQIGVSGDSGWSEWTEIVPVVPDLAGGEPIAVDVSGPDATVHVLAFDSRGQVKETREQGITLGLRWTSWESLPRSTSRLDRGSRLTAVQTDRLYLFGMSIQGEILVCEFHPGNGWRNWQNLGGEFTGEVAAGVHSNGIIEVVGRAKSNQLMARRQISPGVW
jgi:hypothetical protein